MKIKMQTTKMVYYYQSVNKYGHIDKTCKVEMPGLGVTITDAFEEWKSFMAACGYFGMEQYELRESEESLPTTEEDDV